jgi:hypothetical protein
MALNYLNSNVYGQGLGLVTQSSGSRTATALSSAYTYGSAGNVLGIRYSALKASGIDKLYVYVDTVTGTAGNVSLRCEIRNEHTSLATQPGSSVLKAAVISSTPSSGHWVVFDFSASPYVPAVGEVLWFVLYNAAAAPATDFPNLLSANAAAVPFVQNAPNQFRMYASTNGFSTAGTILQGRVAVVKHTDGTIQGCAFTRLNTGSFSSSTRERGIVIESLDLATWVYCLTYIANLAAPVSGVKIYGAGNAGGTQGPNTAITQGVNGWQFAMGSDSGQSRDRVIGTKIIAPILLAANTKYRVVFTYGSVNNSPTVYQIESASDFSDLTLAGAFGNGIGYSTVDDGAGGWTDDKSAWGGIALGVQSQVVPVGGPILQSSIIGAL